MFGRSTCLLLLASVVISLSFPLQYGNIHAVKHRSATLLTRLHMLEQGDEKSRKKKSEPDVSSWLEEFQTAKGSIVDPYKVLRVPRTATKADIKQSYRKLSRKLHPDMVANRDILPGNCANLEEVREEWEKVKLSYEILTDKKMRQKYDRHATVADPGAALGRAAMTAVGWGLSSVWKVGEKAVKAGVSSAASVKGTKDQ